MKEQWSYYLVGGVAIIGIFLPLVLKRRGESDEDTDGEETPETKRMCELMEADRAIPLRFWMQAAHGLLEYGNDYGYLYKESAVRLLESPWGISDRNELEEMISAIQCGDDTDNLAWIHVRVIILARLGFCSGYLSETESWGLVLNAAQRLQKAYRTWEEMGTAYGEGRQLWLGEMGVDDPLKLDLVARNMALLKENFWPEIDFKVNL